MSDSPPPKSPDAILPAAQAIVDAAKDAGVPLCLIGGLAIYVRCPSAHVPPLARSYGDVDLVTTSRSAKRVRELLGGLGYVPNTRFNAINAGERMLFWEESEAWRIDVFVDTFKMCHAIDLRKRVDVGQVTLHPADLLLTKLQIVELNDKDVRDMAALILDHQMTEDDNGINAQYLARLTASDWGLHHTVERNLAAIETNLPALDDAQQTAIIERLSILRQRMEGEPKSMKWNLRARVGERLQWYELPEEAVRG